MAKPSIFSSSYKKQMERRRKQKKLLILLVVILLIGFGIYRFGKITVDQFNKGIVDNTGSNSNYEDDTLNSDENDNESNKEEEKDPPKEKINKVELKVDDLIVGEVKSKKDSNIIEEVSLNEGNYSYEINFSKNLALLYDSVNQKLYSFNSAGEMKDITYKEYISTKGIRTSRESALKMKSNFVWMQNTRFIGDNKVVYTTNLPWFNTDLYLWYYDIETGKYDKVRSNGNVLTGMKVEMMDNSGDNIEVLVDNVKYKIDINGIATKI